MTSELLLGGSRLFGYLFLEENNTEKEKKKLTKATQNPFSILSSDKLAFNSTTNNPESVPSGCTLQDKVLVSGAVGEGGHHVAPALGHCPAVLLGRTLEPVLSPGAVRVEREHLLQVLEHVVKESVAETPLLKLPPVSVHGLLVGLEVAVKVSLLVALILGVEVVLVPLLVLAKVVKVFEDVVEVEGLVVMSEVVRAPSFASTSSMALPR